MYSEVIEGELTYLPLREQEKVQQAYYLLLGLEDIKDFISVFYKISDAYNSYSKDQKKLLKTLHEIYQNCFKRSSIKSIEKKNRRFQSMDIYDNQTDGYLERIARSMDRLRRGNGPLQGMLHQRGRTDNTEESENAKVLDNWKAYSGALAEAALCDGFTISREFIELFSAEAILLAVLAFRQLIIINDGKYSDMYWPVPGLYHTALGIYGNNQVKPTNFFEKIRKEILKKRKDISLFDGHISIFERDLLKLSRTSLLTPKCPDITAFTLLFLCNISKYFSGFNVI